MTRVLLAVAWLGLCSLARADGEAVTLRLPEPKPGETVRVTVTSDNVSKLTVTVGDKDTPNEAAVTKKSEYTETVIERPDGAPRPTKLTRTYKTAEVTEKGNTRTLPYQGKTVAIEKAGDKYTFTVDKAPLAGADAVELDRVFNRPGQVREQDFLPAKPVAVGETWTADPAKLIAGMEATNPFRFDKDKAKVTGKLVKAEAKGQARYGVYELRIDLPISSMILAGNEVPAGPKSGITMKFVFDGCIDGTVPELTKDADIAYEVTAASKEAKITASGRTKDRQVIAPAK